MRKKTLRLIVLGFMVTLLATSCSKRNLIEPNAGVGQVRKGMNEQQVEALLGKPNSKANGMWRYQHKGLMVLFGTNGVMFNVHCFKPFPGRTPEGIGIGSAKAELIKAYGTPNQAQPMDKDMENLYFMEQKIGFTLKNDKVTEMVVHMDVY